MIGLSRIERAISDAPKGGMRTGDPKVTLKLCDAQRIKAELEHLTALSTQAESLLDESRQHSAAMMNRLYESLGIDDSDGEVRFKWVMVEIEGLKRQRNELAATVERMSTFIKLSAKKWESVPEVEPTFWSLLRVANETPQQHLRDVRADAVLDAVNFGRNQTKYFLRSSEDILQQIEQYADSIRQGGTE